MESKMLKQFAVPEEIAVRIPGDAMRGAGTTGE